MSDHEGLVVFDGVITAVASAPLTTPQFQVSIKGNVMYLKRKKAVNEDI